MIDFDAISASLADTRETLRASGYELGLDNQDDTLVVNVVAGPEACAECLVPKQMFKRMIVDRLRASEQPVPKVVVRYPLDQT